MEGLERRLEVPEVHDPAEMLVEFAGDVDGDAEGVPVESGALVFGWQVGEPMGGLEGELAEDLGGGHGIPRYLWVWRLSPHRGCLQAVLESCRGVLGELRAVHWLQPKRGEVEVLVLRRITAGLRIHQLEFVALRSPPGRPRPSG